MELKDVILSTLAEMDAVVQKGNNPAHQPKPVSTPKPDVDIHTQELDVHNDELRFLENIRERLLVLFEGFQSPNNKNIEAKVDLTLNFFEYLLSTIDTRMEKIKS